MTKTEIIKYAQSVEYINAFLQKEGKEQLNPSGYLEYIQFIKEINMIKTYNFQVCIDIQQQATKWEDFFSEWLVYIGALLLNIKSFITIPISIQRKKLILMSFYIKTVQQKNYVARINASANKKMVELED